MTKQFRHFLAALGIFVIALCGCAFPAYAAQAPTPGASLSAQEQAPIDEKIVGLLKTDEDGNRIFTLKAWMLYCKEYYGIEWDKSEYVNEGNKFYLPDTDTEILKPFVKKYDILYRPVEERQAEWEDFHGTYWGGVPKRNAFLRAILPRAASTNVPCEICGATINVVEGDWTRSCYRHTCNYNSCYRPGVIDDEDYGGEYNCRYDVHNKSEKSKARFCWIPVPSQHVRLPIVIDEDSNSPYPSWEDNYCPDHACSNAQNLGAGCSGKRAAGSVYCVACEAMYGDTAAPASVRAAPEGGWLNRNNTVTLSATEDKSPPIQYRVTNSGGGVLMDWSASTTISLGNGSYVVYARDAKGNTSGGVGFSVTNVDILAPNAPGISKSPNTNWHNGAVSVSISHGADNGPSGVNRSEYSFDGWNWSTYWGPVSVSSSTTVYARTVDNTGNVGGASSIGVNIDTAAPSAPSISKSPNTAWANGNVSVTITGGTDSGGSGVARTEYSTDGWNWGTYGGALTLSSTQTVYARTVDHAGNYSSATSAAVNIDKTAPGQPSLSKTPNTAWHNGYVTVTVRAGSDSGGSGVAKTQYSYDNGNWADCGGTVNVTGTCTLYSRTVDHAGNVSGSASIAVSIDRAVPSTPAISKNPNKEWHNDDTAVTITPGTDSGGSGIQKTEYSYNNSNWTTYTSPLNVSSTKTVYTRTWDVAGNVSGTASVQVNIDRVKPVAPTYTRTPDAEWHNGDVKVSVNHGTDADSSARKSEYSYDNVNWQDYATPLTITDSRTVYGRTTDEAGNVSAVSSTQIKIDRTKPTTPAISKNPAIEWSKNDVKVTVTGGTDGDSGVLRTEYSFDNSTWLEYRSALTVSETKTVYCRTLDKAGNASATANVAVNVDKTAPPVPYLSKDPAGAWHNGDVKVTVTQGADTGGSNGVVTEYSTDGKSWTQYKTPLTLAQSMTVYARATDAAGNISATASMQIQIDREKPEAPALTKSPATEWHHGDVTVTVKNGADTGGSGVARSEYSYDNKSWNTCSGTVTVTESRTVYARTVDNGGNVSGSTSIVVKIDRDQQGAPTISKNPSTEWSNGNVRVIITESAATASGIVRTEYSYNERDWTVYTDSLVIGENTMLYVRTLNSAGTYSSTTTEQIKVDTEKPTAPEFSKTPAREWHNGDVTLAILAGEDKVSGVAKTEYSFDGKSWTLYESPLKLTESKTVYARTFDRAGNLSPVSSTEIKIDREAPALPAISKNPETEWANRNVRVEIEDGKDSASGPAKTEYCYDGTSWVEYTGPLTVTSSKTVYTRTTNAANNISGVAEMDIQVDMVPPTIPSISKDPDIAWANVEATITIAPGTDDNSGILRLEYSFDRINRAAH